MRSLLVLCVVYLCVAAAGEIYFKHRAGLPSEFGTFVLPSPSMNAELEDSATYYIEYIAAGGTSVKTSQAIYVDSDVEFGVTILSPILDSLTVTLVDPNGKSVPLQATSTYFPVGYQDVPANAYTFNNPVVGKYQLTLQSSQLPPAIYTQLLNNVVSDGLVLVNNVNDITAHSQLSSYQLYTGSQVGVITRVTEDTISVEDMKAGKVPKAMYNQDTQQVAAMTISLPNGTRVFEVMHDDGLHSDGVANDGVFGGLITASQSGDYIMQATILGTTPSGVTYVRTTEQLVTVIDRISTFKGTAIGVMESSPSNRMLINIALNPASSSSPSESLVQYRAYAEVWGKDSNGNDVAICWIGGMAIAVQDDQNDVVVPLELDLNWVSRVNAQEPFTLKNVILQDPNTFIPYDQAAEMPVKVAGSMPAIMTSLSGKLMTSVNVLITEEMRIGRRPPAYQIRPSNITADTAPILLVHGYCVEVNPWEAVQSEFTNYKLFLSAKSNDKNEAFAKKIIKFGGEGPWSYVAHSQGGLAGVHILEYYMSGMDLVSGGRLVQSLGSPYQGTGAAGMAADLGKMFGAGCGKAEDMTKDGAGLWLATIGREARLSAYYYTTTVTSGSCNGVTNMVLSKPNDGISELNNSQLPGANSLGNVDGWCHSVGMSKPAQTTDKDRNKELNTLAARTPISVML